MAAMNKAHERIAGFIKGELSSYDAGAREALGRRLETDARLRAIVNYLEELTLDLERLTARVDGHTIARCACGEPFAEHPARISEACGPTLSSGFVPVSAPAGEPKATPTNTSEASRFEAPSAGLDEVSWDGSHPPPTPPQGEAVTMCGCAESKSLQEQVYALQDRLAECDEKDSAALRLLRVVIDDQLGWEGEEQEEAGDYLARLREVADQFAALKGMKDKLERAHANIQADRDRASELARAARELATRAEKWLLPVVVLEHVAKLREKLAEYDDYIPF